MGFFSSMYTKEGPGVRKDQPPKKGVARFFEILVRDYGHLLKANLLFCLCWLPLVMVVSTAVLVTSVEGLYLGVLLIAAVLYVLCAALAGPAMTCLHCITVKTVRDEPCYMWHEFKKCWKANWRQSVPAGIIFCTLFAMEIIAVLYYLMANSQGSILLVAFVLFSLLLLTICWEFTTLQMLFLDLPLFGMLKNSLLIMFGYAKRSLPAGIISLVVTAASVLLVPWPLIPIIMLLGVPVLVAVIADMWAWPVMEKAFRISEQQAELRAARERQEQAEAAAAAETAAKRETEK